MMKYLFFPFFLFIVGISIVYAMASKKIDPADHRTLILKAIRREVEKRMAENLESKPGVNHAD